MTAWAWPSSALERLHASSFFLASASIVANAIAAVRKPILKVSRSSRTKMAQLTQLAWQIEAPRATIRGLDVVDALFSIPLLSRSEQLWRHRARNRASV